MRTRPIALLLAAAALTVGLAGCGADEDGTALAVRQLRWDPDGGLVAVTECADIHQIVVVGTEVWIRGRPKVGRCHPAVALRLPAGSRAITDAATGMVVDVPPRPAT